MSLEQIIVLALIQGITEYLPISSSGHLILVPALTGWPDQGILTDMVTNLGTLFATMIFFWRDVISMFWGLVDIVKRRATYNSKLVTNVLIGTVPILVAGVVLKLSDMDVLIRSPMLVAINSIVFGFLLYAADSYGLFRRSVRDLTWKTSLIIGMSQMFSLSPGTSRSGVTMTAGRALGFSRPEAARFSFLLSIPANAAASIFVIGDAVQSGESISGPVILTGILTFFIGIGTITVLMRLIRNHSFLPFVLYRVALGGLLLGMIYSGVTFGTVN
jgi:undecaprenyl-diphosphatase